ncbi:DUF1080 domain-containing protein [Luteolibacter pohnpeiensis]|uniref:DUF1080 domain-containing protein n=1 Tax=Luteolibacter pohnpeiensis TaxID=454153 RepID=A0A934VX53_9BACT|nr:DUF1080 domain-containing protein [Luteolibacter pohnpeiensis]MBK1883189.1 DUF1080 domain-containing protein [Luteolibacter pohnpeiensis]
MKFLFVPLLVTAFSIHASAADPVMRPLFNGKDLTGWTGDGYVVEDGTIVCTPAGKNLVTEGTYTSYILDFEFKLPPGGNNGLGIHYPGYGDSAYTGMELQILDNTAPQYANLLDTQYHGSIYKLAAAKKGFLKPVGEWNRERVSVLGPAVMVELNGEIILRQNLDDLAARNPEHQGVKRRSGHIAFLGHGDPVAFRNIGIVEVPPAANTEGVIAAGFKQIFDGKSLNGWKHDPDNTHNWFVSNDVLKHDGKEGATNDLWTEKSYKDFTLVFDWRWAGDGEKMQRPIVLPDGNNKTNDKGEPVTEEIEELDSGIYLRGSEKSQVNLWNWSVGSGEVYGYRTDKNQTPAVRAGVTPKMKADAPVGQWNRTMITLKGDRLTVVLNGRVVIENAQLPDVNQEGPIGLQHHGQAIDFANLWIKEL